ncbi:MAG: hypothetical protein ACREQ5_35125, partial [Candidatus Dormibacteria bacterium]
MGSPKTSASIDGWGSQSRHRREGGDDGRCEDPGADWPGYPQEEPTLDTVRARFTGPCFGVRDALATVEAALEDGDTRAVVA